MQSCWYLSKVVKILIFNEFDKILVTDRRNKIYNINNIILFVPIVILLTVQTSKSYRKGMKKNKKCTELELYSGDKITGNRNFQCVLQAFYRKIKTQLKVKQERGILLWRKLAEQQFIRPRSKRSILLIAPPSRKQLLYEKSDINQPRPKLPSTVEIAVSFHTKLLLLIYKSNVSYLLLKFTLLSNIASEPSG